MKKILIIGGTGIISTSLTETLAKDPLVELTILNRGHHPEKLPKNVEVLTADINDVEAVSLLLADRKFDAVADFVLFKPEQAQARIAFFKGRTRQFLFISTVACLNHELSPLINELTPRGNRFSTYGQNKAAAELVFLDAYQESGFPVTIIRPAQTYSDQHIPISVKGQSVWSVVKRIKEGQPVILHGDGQSLWASTHAEDFARAFIPLINHPQAIGEILQLINPTPHTWLQVYTTLAELLGVELHPVFIPSDVLAKSQRYDLLSTIQGDKMFSCLYDINKLKRFVPDFKPQVSLREGLSRYLVYMKQHPELQTDDPDFDAWCDALVKKYMQCVHQVMLEN
jgi:nucleoside-diphosphate-sugar epimerase